MSEQEKTPCCGQKVDALIANEQTHFTAEDKEWLSTLSDDQVAKLEPITPVVEKPQVNREEAVAALNLKALEDYVKLMPEELQAQVNSGLKFREDYRSATIKAIQDNAEDGTWTNEELQTMSCEMLGKISKTIQQPVDYSGAGAGGDGPTTNEDQEVLMPVVPREKTK